MAVSHWGQILDSTYTAPDAEIIIFGDSAAIYGVEPARLRRQLGLQAVIVPGTLGSLPITGDRPLRFYLAQHPPPRLIVFYFTPWNLDFKSSPSLFPYEGDEQVLRHGSLGDIVELARRTPLDLLAFPLRFYATPSRLMGFRDPSVYRPVEIDGGHTPFPGTSALGDSCVLPDYAARLTALRSVQEMVRDFNSARTQTMVYLAPLPDCRGAAAVARAERAGLTVAPPAILPHRNFADGGFFVHPLPAAVPLTTDLLGAAIQQALTGPTEH